MKLLLSFFAVILFAATAHSQYYYNDILSIRKLNTEYATLRASDFHLIQLKSFEDDNTPSEGFFCEKKMNKDFSQSEMLSKSYITGESLLNSYYTNGRVSKTINTTPTTRNTTTYTYDAGGNLSVIKIETTSNDDSAASFTEERMYSYDDLGNPLTLKRKKNGKQVSEIDFKKDEKGNIIEEDPQGSATDRKYYYYYDDQNRLTDIVHFNSIAQKLLPDYMFLYDEQNTLKQMISVDESGRNYFIWKYQYTSAGLPEIQKCYSKERRLLGTIQYDYK